MKKLSKILTFILALAMALSTVAMAEVVTPPATQADTTYTVTAGTFANGTMTLKYGSSQTPLTSGSSVTIAENTEVTVELDASGGYEPVKTICKTSDGETTLADGGKFTVTGDTTLTPVFSAKSTVGKPTEVSYRLDAICNSSYNWQRYHQQGLNKFTKYPGDPANNVTSSSEIVAGDYVDMTLYVKDKDFVAFASQSGYDSSKFSVSTPGDSSFLAGNFGSYSNAPKPGADIGVWEENGSPVGMTIALTGVYYVGGSDNTVKLIVTQGNYNAIITCKVDNATITPEKPDHDNNETTAAQPYVIISSYSYGGSDLVAGETRNITMTFRNTSKTMSVENMMVTMTLPDAMMLTSSSNSFYIESLEAEGNITKTVNVTVKPTAAAQSHSMTVDFTYDYLDNGVRRNAKTTETISMPVLQVDRFTVTGIDLATQIFVGEENNLSVNFVNKSRTDIYNLSAKLNCEALSNNGEEQYLGNLSSGTTSSADFYITANDKGEIVGEVIITYEDTNMNQRTVSVPFVTNAVSYDDIYGPTDPVDPVDPVGPVEPETGSFPWFWVVVGVVVVAAGVFVYLKLRKNKKESVEEDEDI